MFQFNYSYKIGMCLLASPPTFTLWNWFSDPLYFIKFYFAA